MSITTPTEDLKSVATELARSLASDTIDEKTAYNMLAQLGYPVTEAPPPYDPADDYVHEGNIGIYYPEVIDGKTWFKRNIKFKEAWTLFANVQSIPPKGDRKRVVFLGESVARGFLLDPGYTPAGVLETLLNSSVAGEEEFEVIDLAETNLGMEGIRRRFIECMMLQPDLVIFLAGNNWRSDMEVTVVNEADHYKKLSAAIEKHGGIIGIKGVLEELFESVVDTFIGFIADLAKQHNVSVLFAIPEFNLMDCRATPCEKFVTKLPGETTRQWLEARKQAEIALAAGKIDEAEAHAQTMVTLDPTHPLGFEIMADCNVAKGDYAAARENLETARDSALFCRTDSKPRIYRVIRKTILENAERYNLHVVDIPAVFEKHLKGKVPGRDLFLDYCHFTVEGIQVAMEAVANKALFALSGPDKTVQVKAKMIQPDNQVQAMAHLFAAIHNAHWGQSYGILYYHCSKALQYSKDLAKTMIYYADMMTRRTTNTLCKTFEILVSNFQLDRYIHALRNPRNQKGMELDLVNAMVAALKNVGINLTNYINDLRAKEHSVTEQKINLLKSFYHVTSYDEYHGTKAAFFQARDSQSRFFLLGKKDLPILFSITLRVPCAPGETEKVTIVVNDVPVSEITVSDKWSDHTIAISGDVSVDGVNVITIYWPVLNYHPNVSSIAAARQTTADAYVILDAVFCVFGEIMHFTAVGNSPKTFATN